MLKHLDSPVVGALVGLLVGLALVLASLGPERRWKILRGLVKVSAMLSLGCVVGLCLVYLLWYLVEHDLIYVFTAVMSVVVGVCSIIALNNMDD